MSSKKGLVTTPGGSSKKQDGKKKAATTPMKDPSSEEASVQDGSSSQECRIQLTFQTKSSGDVSLSPIKCLCPASVLRTLQLMPGSYVVIERPEAATDQPGGNLLVCRAWANKRVVQSQPSSDRLVLHKLWQSSFEDHPESKKVVIKSMRDQRFRIIHTKSLILRIIDDRNYELKQSLELRQLIREHLSHCVLSTGTKLSLSLRAKSVTLEVLHAVPHDKQIEKNLSKDSLKVFEFSDKTELVLVTSVEEAQPYFGFEKINELKVAPSGKMSADQALQYLRENFVGYDHAARLALGITCLGLGFLDDNNSDGTNDCIDSVAQPQTDADVTTSVESKRQMRFSLPVGALIYGPPGTGKSELVLGIINSLKCNSVQIDSKLLLSSFQGEAESLLRSKFQEAKALSPCCIVVENMDMICPSRSNSNVSDVQKRIVSCYLSLVDELHGATSRVFILATSTRPLEIDSAVRRSGRIDREIELSVPSSADREKVLQFMCKKHGIAVVEDECMVEQTLASHNLWIKAKSLRDASHRAHGMVASDLLQVLKEACYLHTGALTTSSDQERIIKPDPQSSSAKLTTDDDSMVCNLLDDFTGLKIDNHSNKVSTQPKPAQKLSFFHLEISQATILAAVQRIPPSALREVVVEVPTVRWTDIGGMESVKDSLKQVVEWPILHPEWFASLGIPPLKGVLLYGPPGCSKTLMAKAVATESSMNFLAVRGPELLSKWLGESEKAVQSLFKKARAAAPSIVFFDEIDALAGVRGESSAGVSDRVLSQLLTELDGIQGRKQVVVIAATNRPDMLDPALIRPGRIDRKIYVPPPDDASRESILRLELKKLPLSGAIDFQELINVTRGFSGAEVVAVCNEAALYAIDRDADSLTQEDILAAARKITPQITADMIKFYTNFASKNQ